MRSSQYLSLLRTVERIALLSRGTEIGRQLHLRTLVGTHTSWMDLSLDLSSGSFNRDDVFLGRRIVGLLKDLNDAESGNRYSKNAL